MKLIAWRVATKRWTDATIGAAVGITIDGFLRHERTKYDEWLGEGFERSEARRMIKPEVEAILEKWATPKQRLIE